MEDTYVRLINCRLRVFRFSVSSFSSQYLLLYFSNHLGAVFVSGRTIIYSINPFRENNNVVVFPIPFHIVMPLANLLLIRLQGEFPILRIRSYPDLYTLIRPPRRSLALCRVRILIPGFNWSLLR